MQNTNLNSLLGIRGMKTIYCISGLGADEMAFSKLRVTGYELKVIPWLIPEQNETIQQYAARMRADIKEEFPILMGLSFGGMICTEIAKQVPVKKLIIISSIKSSEELPTWMKAVAKLRLHKILPLGSSKLTEPIQNMMLGASSKEERQIASHYRKKWISVIQTGQCMKPSTGRTTRNTREPFTYMETATACFPSKISNQLSLSRTAAIL